MRKIVTLILMSLALVQYAGAENFEQIRAAAAKDGYVELKEGTFIEGVIVSDYKSLNMGENPQVAWNEVDLRVNYCTAYIQSEDASAGFRILFDDIYDNRVPRFSKVRIDLSGATVQLDKGGYTIFGVSKSDVEVLSSAVAPAKVKSISQLSQEDIYTFVTVPDVEFLSKEGSYTNVNEYMVQTSYLNAFKKPKRQNCVDVAGVYLKDKEGEALFMPVNTSCEWRRRGDRLPQGVGSVSGILVPAGYDRFGDVGPFALRIAGPDDVAISMESASSYKTIVEWNWDRNYKHALNLEKQGDVHWLSKNSVSADRILPDVGTGFLSTSVAASMMLTPEYNTRNTHDGHQVGIGSRPGAALRLDAESARWFAPGAAIVVETSTKDFSGSAMTLDFTWCAGTGKIEESYGFPAEWQVAYSVDGRNFLPLQKVFSLRPVAYEKSPLSYYAAPGFVENTIALPGFLLGQEKLWIRIYPASQLMVEKKSDVSADINTGVFSGEQSMPVVICVGKVSLKVVQ